MILHLSVSCMQMIIICTVSAKKNLLHVTALRAYAKEIQAVRYNFKAAFIGYLLCHVTQTVQFWINDFITLEADNMWVGVRFYAIIAGASPSESNFKHLSQ